MNAPAQKQKFPHRDALGRVETLPDLLVGVVVWLVICLVLLAGADGIAVAFGRDFGTSTGWLAGILAVWLFAEEYRAWAPVPARIVVAAGGVVLGLLFGIGLSSLVSALPALFSGFIGVAVGCFVYAIVWYFGVRVMAHRSGEE